MIDHALHPIPDLRATAAAQLRAVGLAVRREVLVAEILYGAILLYTVLYAMSKGESIGLGHIGGPGVLAGLAGFLFPIAVWKGEERFGFSAARSCSPPITPGAGSSGTVLGVILLEIVGEEAGIAWMDELSANLLSRVGFSRYGLEPVLTSGTESIQHPFHLPSGETVPGWRELPTFVRWAGSLLLWSAIGLAGMLAATWRHRER